MGLKNLGGHRTVNGFVRSKLKKLDASDGTMSSLFELMFSERENVMYEQSRGYRMEKTTYGQAYDSILRLCPSLSSALDGCPRGAAVGLYMQNSLLWIELFWAILRCGYRPLLMNSRLGDDTLEYALSSCGAAAVISDGKIFSVRTVNCADLKESDGDFSPSFADELFVMSSGTSAHVKLCAYSGRQFCSMIRGSADIIKNCRQIKKHYDGSLKLLTFLPFCHIFGLIAVYVWFAFFSRTFVHLSDLAPDTIVNTVKRHGVTHIFAVPLFWETVYNTAMKTVRARGEDTVKRLEKGLRIADSLAFCPPLRRLFSRIAFKEVRERIFGDSVMFMITGGSRISGEVMRFFNNSGYRLADGYGMSEIGITSVELSSDIRVLNSCSVGKPLSGVTYSVSDRGTLLVSGGCMAKYLIADGKKTPMPDVFDTLDLCECDRGRYKITGRNDDLIISPTGENINPGPLEEALSVRGARGVCLSSIASENGDVPVLVVSAEPYLSGAALDALRERIKEKISSLGISTEIKKIIVTKAPLLEGDEFKLNRRRIRAAIADGSIKDAQTSADVAGKLDAAALFVRDCFAAACGKDADDISPDADFFSDLGGSSLEYFAVISRLGAEFGIPFPEQAGTGLSTVNALGAYIRERTEERIRKDDKTV